MIWNPQAEALPREEMAALQLARLRETVSRVLASASPIRGRLHEYGIRSADEIASLADLARLPFTVKRDLRDHYPFGLFAVPRDQVLRIQASSGTRGKPTVAGYTKNDLDVWTEVMARTMVMAGVRPGMVMHNAYGYGLFTGGFGFHQGAERIGCTVIPVSGGMTQRQIMLLQDLGGEVLGATPSYALTIGEAIERAGVDPRSLSLKIGLFGAEPWSETMRAEIERRLGLTAINCYGLSEIVGPGVAAECAEGRNGLHINEDHFLPEIIDPETGEPLPLGQEGELVLTTLTKEAVPMIRYRTGDRSALLPGDCTCGRTTIRMAPVPDRYDDMLIVRGVNLYPSEIERALAGVAGLAPHFQIVVDRPGTMDELTVCCEVHAACDPSEASQLCVRIEYLLREATGLSVRVDLREPNSLPRSEGKAMRVIDNRPKERGATVGNRS